MKQLHSYWAYLVLAVLILAVANAVIGLASKKEFKAKDLRLGLFALIFTHIQLLIGLAWYFMSPIYKALKSEGMGAIMKEAPTRPVGSRTPDFHVARNCFDHHRLVQTQKTNNCSREIQNVCAFLRNCTVGNSF